METMKSTTYLYQTEATDGISNKAMISEVDFSEKSTPQEYGLQSRRFFQLILMTAAFTLNAVAFSVDNLQPPDYLFYFSQVAFLFLLTKSLWVIDELGVKHMLVIAMIFQTLALWFGRTFSSKVFGTDLVAPTFSEILNSVALVLLLNSITKFSSQWFGQKGRIQATATMLGGRQIGLYLVYWYLKLAGYDYNNYLMASSFQFACAVINFALLLLIILFFHNEPEKLASRSQRQTVKQDKLDFDTQFEQFMQSDDRVDYMKILISLAVYCYCSPYNFYWYLFYNNGVNLENDQFVAHLIQPIVFTVGILVFGFLLSQSLSFRKTIIFLIIMNIAATVATELCYLLNSNVAMQACYCIHAFFVGGLKITVFEMVTDYSYPISPSVTMGIFNTFTNTIILSLTMMSDEIDRTCPDLFLYQIYER
ncbi:UNKNOWN [Stylonychia lemnae]|uniref:Uncharacterized protein n=1 Tax=Stylonychia lemnae TaxID=5949 RepID=A0A078AL39_STYLE|nr:UNKNOWN [Stylonychia lemnae]|eukprot:CDW82899.1 UNKNOWN [Stylonychia lemnae]